MGQNNNYKEGLYRSQFLLVFRPARLRDSSSFGSKLPRTAFSVRDPKERAINLRLLPSEGKFSTVSKFFLVRMVDVRPEEST